MDLGLDGRCYLLTGASTGLGFATARALVDEGAKVVLCARDRDRLHRAVERLPPGHAVGVTADLLSPATPEVLLHTAHRAFGRLDGALLGTGTSARGTVLDATDDDWRTHFELLFLPVLRCARTLAPALPADGALALLLSTSARTPLPDFALSTGLRPGLAMAARSLAAELGPRGIRVLSLLPGRFPTEGTPLEPAETPATTALRRYGLPEEFGRAAAFCLSPAAGYPTGTEIVIDGGKR
ncbi:oxidoreductase [Kitasatospora griseola]|uniref:Oxidoreductase n=1 Tax=Kitasatospora griseola TaxID=2064 RepID=A0A0D0ND66_KITGR|nr:SDR family oxidoreductase [Kitasatospora griseola]KIQ66145.1 oxidoreductase [Kitasatospora griseola]